jgi:hypothetical protein
MQTEYRIVMPGHNPRDTIRIYNAMKASGLGNKELKKFKQMTSQL